MTTVTAGFCASLSLQIIILIKPPCTSSLRAREHQTALFYRQVPCTPLTIFRERPPTCNADTRRTHCARSLPPAPVTRADESHTQPSHYDRSSARASRSFHA